MLINHSLEPVGVDILDGIQNIMPYGIVRAFQLEFSTLADGYKEGELDTETGLAIFKLGSIPTDRPEPSEALKVTTVWSGGLEQAKRLLSTLQMDIFRRGLPVHEETHVRGVRGAYFINSQVVIPAGGFRKWYIVADVDRDVIHVIELLGLLKKKGNLIAEIEEDVKRGTENLIRIVASADGLQCTEDELNAWRHYSNVLFNVMREGIPDQGYWIQRSDLMEFIKKVNRNVAQRHAFFLNSLPDKILHEDLIIRAEKQGDLDLERIVYEYLPLAFSRRHGDPSRPWNFSQ